MISERSFLQTRVTIVSFKLIWEKKLILNGNKIAEGSNSLFLLAAELIVPKSVALQQTMFSVVLVPVGSFLRVTLFRTDAFLLLIFRLLTLLDIVLC